MCFTAVTLNGYENNISAESARSGHALAEVGIPVLTVGHVLGNKTKGVHFRDPPKQALCPG